MPTLEDFQNILQSAEQERIQRSPLYQRVAQEQMREQQKMQEIPQELMPVFDELRGAQERNEVRGKLQRYNTAVQYCGGGRINKFDGVTGPSDMNTFVQMNPITGWQPEYYKDFGIGNHPAFDEDFRTRYGLRYAPYNEIDFGGTSPDNIRVQNQNNMTAQAFQWSNPTGTLLVGPDNRIINQQRLTELSNQYRRDNAEMLNRRYAKALSEKPLEQKNPEFYLLAGGAHALQSAANKGLTAAFVDPMMNMQMTDKFISNTTPYSGWGNMMSENAGGPEWAWDLAHPAFAKDLWNLTKAAGNGAYNWMAEHTPESAYNFGITPSDINPLEPFDWDAFAQQPGAFVDDAARNAVSRAHSTQDIITMSDDEYDAMINRMLGDDTMEQATRGIQSRNADREIRQLMNDYGIEEDEARRLYSATIPDEQSAQTVEQIQNDFDSFWGNEPAAPQQVVDVVKAEPEKNSWYYKKLPQDELEQISYEEASQNPQMLEGLRQRFIEPVHPDFPDGSTRADIRDAMEEAMNDFNKRLGRGRWRSTERTGPDFSAESAPMVLNQLWKIQKDMVARGEFPGVALWRPGTRRLNRYGRVNFGTKEAPMNPHFELGPDGRYHSYFEKAGHPGYTLEDMSAWPSADDALNSINTRLQRLYDLNLPYSPSFQQAGRDAFKAVVGEDSQILVPDISFFFANGGPINSLKSGGKTSNSQQLWDRARPLYNELIMAGVPHMAAIGVLGNIALESGVNPNASNKVNGGHWGYTQNDKAITDHIKKYYGGNGHREQMQFLKDGLTGQIRGAKQAPWLQKRFDEYRHGINGINDPAKAALMWEKYYEKSANEAFDKRADYAKYFHNALGSPDYQYSPDKYNSRAGLGPLISQTTEEETPEQAPWYNQYQLNDADYAALYEQNNTPLPMFDTSLVWNPIQPEQSGGGFPNLFAGGGYIEDGLRSLGVNGFKVTSGYRGPNSKVGKAGKRSGHAHTLKDGSSGAIDIVPVDKSPAGWARLEQQLRQPEVQQFLASFGGTILDERDAATMRKTGATGQHFHIGLGVKGDGNFYNQSAAESSYARRSPISVFSPIQSSTVDDGSTAPWYAQGSGMTDEDWATLYNQTGGLSAGLFPGRQINAGPYFPELV